MIKSIFYWKTSTFLDFGSKGRSALGNIPYIVDNVTKGHAIITISGTEIFRRLTRLSRTCVKVQPSVFHAR